MSRQPFQSRITPRLRGWNAAAAGAPASDDETLARIETLSRVARGAWFGLLGYLAFVGLTLLAVRDVDFFSLEASTTLPLVGVAIPTQAFFWTAPWLGAALHVWLHLHLLKLWDALAEATARIDGAPLGDRAFPWLATDWALRRRPDAAQATTPRPMAWLADWVTALLLWGAAPLLITLLWWRSMPAHEEWLTLAIAAALWFALYATLHACSRALWRLKAAPGPAPDRAARPDLCRFAALALITLALLVVSWLRPEGGFDYYANRLIDTWEAELGPVFEARGNWGDDDYMSAREVQEAWVAANFLTLRDVSGVEGEDRIVLKPFAAIDLIDADLARRPEGWVNHDVAERRFTIRWCADRAVPLTACTPPRSTDYADDDALAAARAAHRDARIAWCAENGALEWCEARFAALDATFRAEWAEQRASERASLARPDMHRRDLRHATAARAFLAGLDLSQARMEGAILSEAQMEGADLSGARMEGAILRGARMEGAILRGARMEGADLSGARMEGADLRQARLQSADWAGTILGASPAQSADFSDARNLTQDQLDLLVGDERTILPPGLHVWSCWREKPAGFDAISRSWEEFFGFIDRNDWLCKPGEAPRKVGRQAAPSP